MANEVKALDWAMRIQQKKKYGSSFQTGN